MAGSLHIAGASNSVPGVDSTDNSYVSDVIGNKSDTHDGDSLMALVHSLEEHVHKGQFCYPDLADAITLTADASGWTYGAWVEVIPANGITSDFDLHWVNIGNISANDQYQIQIGTGGAGSETGIACTSFERTAVTSQEGDHPVQTPIIAANTRVALRLACKSTNARTCEVKLHYHTY